MIIREGRRQISFWNLSPRDRHYPVREVYPGGLHSSVLFSEMQNDILGGDGRQFYSL
jgi:hypothetical protein